MQDYLEFDGIIVEMNWLEINNAITDFTVANAITDSFKIREKP